MATIPMPKFLVTTIAPENQMAKDWLKANPAGVYEGAYEFDSKSEQSSGGEQPVFLMGVTYEGKSSITDEDEGEGKFEGKAVSHAVFTEALAKEGKDLVFFIHGYKHAVASFTSPPTQLHPSTHPAHPPPCQPPPPPSPPHLDPATQQPDQGHGWQHPHDARELHQAGGRSSRRAGRLGMFRQVSAR